MKDIEAVVITVGIPVISSKGHTRTITTPL